GSRIPAPCPNTSPWSPCSRPSSSCRSGSRDTDAERARFPPFARILSSRPLDNRGECDILGFSPLGRSAPARGARSRGNARLRRTHEPSSTRAAGENEGGDGREDHGPGPASMPRDQVKGTERRIYAHDQSACPQAAPTGPVQDQGAGPRGLPVQEGRVPPGQDDDPQEAQLG